jgi:hypothetical protein
VITCVVSYTIDPRKIADFERFAQRWMSLVNAHGGTRYERTFMRPLLPEGAATVG